MKRTVRLAIILIAIAIVVAGIGFWRNHYLKIQNAEPKRVYKDAQFEPDTLPKTTSAKPKKADKSTSTQQDTSSEDTSVQRDDTDIALEPSKTAQPTDDSITPEATDNTGELNVHTVFTDIIVENLPPKAAAALKQYDEAQLATTKITAELIDLYKAKPIDFDAIGEGAKKLKKLNDQRMDSLEILSEYSKKASDMYNALIAQYREVDNIMEDFDEGLDIDIDEIQRRLESARESR